MDDTKKLHDSACPSNTGFRGIKESQPSILISIHKPFDSNLQIPIFKLQSSNSNLQTPTFKLQPSNSNLQTITIHTAYDAVQAIFN